MPPTTRWCSDYSKGVFIVTGTSSRDSLLSWIRLLEKHGNPLLSNIPVIFTLTAPPTDLSIQETELAIKAESNTSTS